MAVAVGESATSAPDPGTVMDSTFVVDNASVTDAPVESTPLAEAEADEGASSPGAEFGIEAEVSGSISIAASRRNTAVAGMNRTISPRALPTVRINTELFSMANEPRMP